MKKKIFLFLCFLVLTGSCFYGYIVFKRPKISVVMSTYNRAEFLPRSIDSILAQTEKDFEFLIINDGSSDNTAEILDKYAKQDKRIRVITNNPNKGLIYSLNKGLKESKGKYIARMDDDDIALPTRFEKQYAFMEKNNDIAVVGSWIGSPENSSKWGFQDETSTDKIKVLVYLNTVPIAHPAAMIRKSFLDKHNLRYSYKYQAAEDRKLWLDIIDAGGKITNIPEILLLFRIHSSHSREYYSNQQKNIDKFFHREILPKFADQKEFEGLDYCQRIKKMAHKNQSLNYLSQPVFNQIIKETCPPDTAEKVIHPRWTDVFVFEEKRVYRHQNKDYATIMKKTDNVLTIKWDKWGTETFEKKDNIWYLKK